MFENMLVSKSSSKRALKKPSFIGDEQLGFFGFIDAASFITGDQLAYEIGLTTGISHNSDAGWFKYILNGKICYVAKKTFRYFLQWDDIYKVGAAYGTDDEGVVVPPDVVPVLQNKTVVVNGDTYRVRLMQGSTADPSIDLEQGLDVPESHGSEWNKVIYRLLDYDKSNPNNVFDSETIVEKWGNYSEEDLNIVPSPPEGVSTMCKESFQGNTRVVRGNFGASLLGSLTSSSSQFIAGWRPVLEKV